MTNCYGLVLLIPHLLAYFAHCDRNVCTGPCAGYISRLTLSNDTFASSYSLIAMVQTSLYWEGYDFPFANRWFCRRNRQCLLNSLMRSFVVKILDILLHLQYAIEMALVKDKEMI